MSEALNNSQNNTANTAPTGWEQMENYEPEPTAASETASEEDLTRQRGSDTLNILSRLRLDKLPEDAKKRLQDELRKSTIETILDDSYWDGDGVKDDVEQGNIAESKQFYEDTDEDKLRMLEFEDMSNSELIGLFTDIMGDDEPTVSEYDTEPPILTDVPGWLDSWEEKKKTF